MIYRQFKRQQWCRFRQDAPLTLTVEEINQLQGQNEVVSVLEVEEVYLPLSRLLNFYVTATQSLHQASNDFLGQSEPKVPYIIGIAGSVAVGKSTTARVLQALLSRWSDHPHVVLLSTDGFLFPNEVLEQRDLMSRKGFPESYDMPRLLQCLQDIKSGKRHVQAPVYSHHNYNIMPDQMIDVDRPDIVIIEGLNILQTGVVKPGQQPRIFVSDFFDFSVYVDADTNIIRQWFVDRVLSFCEGAFQDPTAYFHHLSTLTHEEIVTFAGQVWRDINEVNLIENVLPFRERADCILHKRDDHAVQSVWLKKL